LPASCTGRFTHQIHNAKYSLDTILCGKKDLFGYVGKHFELLLMLFILLGVRSVSEMHDVSIFRTFSWAGQCSCTHGVVLVDTRVEAWGGGMVLNPGCFGQWTEACYEKLQLLCIFLSYFWLLTLCRSQWPRGLRHELSSLTRTLGSWVRIPLKVWMSVCVYSVFVLGSDLATG
jgi:hypothetical protein